MDNINMYNELDYWNKRNEPNSSDVGNITPQHLKFVSGQINGESILEFGPGIGRILPAYGGRDVSVFDISNKYLGRLKKEADALGMKLDVTIDDNPILPYEDNQFDVVVCVSVLLHQRPQNIIQVMKELHRVGKKVVVVSWSDDNVLFDDYESTYEGGRHCYHYDFKSIAKEYNFKISHWEQRPEMNQIFFTYE